MSNAHVVDRCGDPANTPGAPLGPSLFRFAPTRYARAVRRRYVPSYPRAALGALAVAMTAITLGVLVLLPAALETVAATLY